MAVDWPAFALLGLRCFPSAGTFFPVPLGADDLADDDLGADDLAAVDFVPEGFDAADFVPEDLAAPDFVPEGFDAADFVPENFVEPDFVPEDLAEDDFADALAVSCLEAGFCFAASLLLAALDFLICSRCLRSSAG